MPEEHLVEGREQSSSAAPRALVVALQRPWQSEAEVVASCEELERLAGTLGITVVGREIQSRSTPSASTFVGSGKLRELAVWTGGPGELPQGGKEGEKQEPDEDAPAPRVDLVLVDAELSPGAQRALEIALATEVLDRTAVILEIFEDRARTHEARLEVEIARLRYELPRLRDSAARRARQSGGGGRGARGNTAVELGKGRIRDRIAQLEAELADAQSRASSRRERRHDVFQAVLVGYTNAGKSSLMRGLTESEVLVEDKLFATLGTTVRRLRPATTPAVLLSDTVGFIKNLPHELVASFRSTLDEALDAQLILLVVDASDPQWPSQLEVTRETLESIGATEIATRLVLNKVDQLDEETRAELARQWPEAILLSALDSDDRRGLRDALVAARDQGLCEETLLVPFEAGQLLGEIYERASVVEESHSEHGTLLRVRARPEALDRWWGKLDLPAIETVDALFEAARVHGLELAPEQEHFDDEAGADYRVARGSDDEGDEWLARTPRRPEVVASSRLEGRVLRLVGPRLPVAVPQWRLHTPRVTAWPLLPGAPAWPDHDGGASPSPAFLESLAGMLAALQSIDAREVAAAEVPAEDLDQLRQERRELIVATRDALDPDEAVVARWERWLDEDRGWPRHRALVHGDLHPGHMLVDPSGRLTGVLDWAEAKLSDPTSDLIPFYASFGEAGLRELVERFEGAGGRSWSGMVDHVVESWAFFPVTLAARALEAGDAGALERARLLLKSVRAEG